ncbi:fumarylacetoacetate hydrolase family protein [Poriferisphaera sp. WC338]|uniref:fumarylacetoacetate hydrolase family protein n=1 Tax=Poriferisphaera sp. WC338 TaxID=3425129 RepID=UPI003D81404C
MRTGPFPGSIIMTGIPSGVDILADPQHLLKSSDQLTVTIQDIGALSNHAISEPESCKIMPCNY